MKDVTYRIIELTTLGDETITALQREAILRTCRSDGSDGAMQEAVADNAHPAESPAVDGRMLNIAGLSAMLGICKRTISRLVATGEIPQPVKVGRSSRWLREDIEEYLAKMQQKRDKRHSLGQAGRAA